MLHYYYLSNKNRQLNKILRAKLSLNFLICLIYIQFDGQFTCPLFFTLSHFCQLCLIDQFLLFKLIRHILKFGQRLSFHFSLIFSYVGDHKSKYGSSYPTLLYCLQYHNTLGYQIPILLMGLMRYLSGLLTSGYSTYKCTFI